MIVRPEIKLTAGRNFKPGLREVIVGRAVLERFSGLGVGSSFSSGVAEWTIVGLFESGGDAHESELLADADTVLSAYSRSSFNSVTIWLDNPSSFESIKDSISTNATYSLDVRHESDYYEQQSKRFGRFLSVIANVVGIVMAFGAIFGALNTMYTAVSTRAVEIATLRALGFGAVGVIVSVFVEALLLALIGALIGATLAWVAFNGNTVSTISGGYSLTQVTFNLKVGPDLLVIGIVWACAVGLLGALFPAIRAARTSVADALRQI
jgi:putative ABC transport system permease protein